MKKLIVLIAVIMALLLTGCCPVCPDISEYDCPDVTVDCPEIPACPGTPNCVCPDIPECPACPASPLAGTLVAEDFGWMDFSNVDGYSAGFRVTDAILADAQVVVRLYAINQLLQTNTSTVKFGTDIYTMGTQFSSPFDVFGTFDYVADGYWTNVREVEYGQTKKATKVVAIVTLSNGKVVTAENNIP